MVNLVIKPKDSESCPKPCSPCEEKPRYPKLCLSGTAMKAFQKALGELPDIDQELILDGVRVKVCGLTRNEWTEDLELSVVGFDSVASTGDPDDETEKETKEDAMEKAVNRRSKMD